MIPQDDTFSTLVKAVLGDEAGASMLDTIEIDPALRGNGKTASRAVVAMALNIVLMHGLLARVPTGAGYVANRVLAGRRILFDHGALRTVRFADSDTGALPPGGQAFARILGQLGYSMAGLYPLDRLRMTGRAYSHNDLPETIPQFFVSELHVERFSSAFQATARRVFDSSRDPLTAEARLLLATLAASQQAPLPMAIAGLPALAAAFDRQHEMPTIEDYRLLLEESAEAAWISTEGNAFNHVTDRVADVAALAEQQRALGRPIKDEVEVSSTGRVRQTAYKADLVERRFRTAADGIVRMLVPGSFYEFISRDPFPGGNALDLTFDSGNAQGIFKMTAAAA